MAKSISGDRLSMWGSDEIISPEVPKTDRNAVQKSKTSVAEESSAVKAGSKKPAKAVIPSKESSSPEDVKSKPEVNDSPENGSQDFGGFINQLLKKNPNTKASKSRISVYLPADLKIDFEKKVKKLNMSTNSVINELIRYFVNSV